MQPRQKEPFKSTHKNEIFMNQRFSSSEYGTESTHDKTPEENSDNALFIVSKTLTSKPMNPPTKTPPKRLP
jgi:hypothetical protein